MRQREREEDGVLFQRASKTIQNSDSDSDEEMDDSDAPKKKLKL